MPITSARVPGSPARLRLLSRPVALARMATVRWVHTLARLIGSGLVSCLAVGCGRSAELE
jgi:hypothetical protein